MRRRIHFIRIHAVLVLSLFALKCELGIAQSTVVGGQGIQVYVNGTIGSDKNPGSSAEPLETIQAGVNKALLNNKSGIATVVTIASGVYRESVMIGSTRTSAPITIESAAGAAVYIDGADLLTNPYESSPGIYAFPWTDSVQGCGLPIGWYTGMPPVVLSNEMLFINGAALTQVMAASELVPGTFFVNDSYHDVEVAPPAGIDPNTAQVEVSARRSTLTVTNSSNVVLSGLTFQHAASCLNESGANIFSSSNVLVDQVQANWNNWGGIGISNSSNVTVRNSIASYNGGVGFGASEITNTLYENNEADYNNWRGEMVGLYHWGQGGVKVLHGHVVTVTGQRSYNNGAQGLWFDTDNMNITIGNADLVGNLVSNLQLEANQGPVTLMNSSLCSGGIGANLINTADATLTANHFYGNGEAIANQNAQIYLSGNPGGRIVKNFETGAESNVYTSNTILDGNTFTDVGSEQFVFGTYLSGKDWAEFIDSVHPSNNLWFDANNAMAFGIPDGKHLNFAGWQSISGDTTSSWQLSTAAAQGCSAPAPAYPDFNLFAHNAAAYIPGYTMSGGTLAIPLQVRSFGFGAVGLSVSGLPSGVSASFTPSSLVSGNATLTLTATSSAAAETVPITVFATSGNRVHTITVWAKIKPGVRGGNGALTVTAANASRAYGLPNPPFSGSVSGATSGDTFTVSGTTTATQTSPVGSYSIVPSVSGTNLANYTLTLVNGTLTVTKAHPVIAWAAPASITPGSDLSSVLDATATNGNSAVPGTYAYANENVAINTATVLPAGSYTLHVTFTPTDTADYTTATGTVALKVTSQAVPTINWATPSAIPYGTRLSSSQLNATASVPGTFAYNPAAGTILPLGTATLSVTFTPTDTANYAIATRTVQLVVNAAPDFTMTVNPASLTILAGGSGTAGVTITPVGGFTGALQLTCSGLPANSTCAFSPGTIKSNGAPATTTLTIATGIQKSSLATPPNSAWPRRAVPLSGVGGLLALCFLPRGKRRKGARTVLSALLGLIALGAGFSTIGCGVYVTRSGQSTVASPSGTSTIVVSASSTTPGGTSHSSNLTVTIAN